MAAPKPNYKFGLWAVVGLLIIWNVLFWVSHHHKPQQTRKQQTVKLTYDADHVPLQGDLLTQFKGSGNGQSRQFTAAADWHAYWSFVCDSELGGTFQMKAYGANGKQVGEDVNKNAISGYGDAVYHQSGQFTIKVQAAANCTWKTAVKKLPS